MNANTNTQDPSGKWSLYTADGELVGRHESPDDVREFLADCGETHVIMDVDGQGSEAAVPAEWIGDGEKLIMSDRALALLS